MGAGGLFVCCITLIPQKEIHEQRFFQIYSVFDRIWISVVPLSRYLAFEQGAF